MTVSQPLKPTFPPPRHHGYNRGMVTALLVLAVAYAAMLVWLVVRIVNRGEKWAVWTAAGLCAALLIAAFGGPAILVFLRS